MSLKERIKEIRLANGLSQVKFSERIAISSSYIADLELGKKPVNERILRLICTEYSVNEHWFRTGEGTMYNEKSDVAVAEVVSIFKSLCPQYQSLVLAQINAVAQLQMNPQEV
jgi:transcriptional regulator with XRE-family HTH domain